ncbi:hypothetical protein FCV25MIE_01561 [Fagus crenata]
MAVWFVRDLKLSHQVVELIDGNPSIIRFSIHPNSTHFEEWTKGPYHVLQNRTQIVVGSEVKHILHLVKDSLYTYGSVRKKLWNISEKEHATVESIVGLEEGRLSCCCAICLEEVSAESHVACMPCCHVFHNYCIVQCSVAEYESPLPLVPF